MKVTLEFTLPEEAAELRLALDGGKWCAAMHDLDEQMRGMAKSMDTPVTPSEVRKMLYGTLEDQGLSFD